MSFHSKKAGDPLPLEEFEALERYAFREQRDVRDRIRVKTSMQAVAHATLPPFSVFGMGAHVKSTPLPTFLTAPVPSGCWFLTFTNSQFEIPMGQSFTPMIIGSTYPELARVNSDTVKVGLPCNGGSLMRLEGESEFGLICLSNTFTVKDQLVCWVIRSNVKPKLSAYAANDIPAYNKKKNRLGAGIASVYYSESSAYNPETLAEGWLVPVWNVHQCEIEQGDMIDLTPVLQVGYCVSHPEFFDEPC